MINTSPRPDILHPHTRQPMITAEELTAYTNGHPTVSVSDLLDDWQAARFYWSAHPNYKDEPSPAYVAIVHIQPQTLTEMSLGVVFSLLCQLAIMNRKPTTATE